MENEKKEQQTTTQPVKKIPQYKKPKNAQNEFRRKYFEYYDDVKDRTKGHEDW